MAAFEIDRDLEPWQIATMQLPLPGLLSPAETPTDASGRRLPDGNTLTTPNMTFAVDPASSVGMSGPSIEQDLDSTAPLLALEWAASNAAKHGIRPHAILPGHLIVGPMPPRATAELLDVLTAGGITFELVDRTPAIESLLEMFLNQVMDEAAESDLDNTPSLVGRSSISVDRHRALADAAAGFHEARPWLVDEVGVVWRISPQPRRRALRLGCIMSQNAEVYGIGFLRLEGLAAARPKMPSPEDIVTVLTQDNWSMTFVSADEMPRDEAKRFFRSHFRLDRREAFPLAASVGGEGPNRPSATDLTLMEGLMRVLARITAGDVQRGLIERTIETFDGPMTLRLDSVGP